MIPGLLLEIFQYNILPMLLSKDDDTLVDHVQCTLRSIKQVNKQWYHMTFDYPMKCNINKMITELTPLCHFYSRIPGECKELVEYSKNCMWWTKDIYFDPRSCSVVNELLWTICTLLFTSNKDHIQINGLLCNICKSFVVSTDLSIFCAPPSFKHIKLRVDASKLLNFICWKFVVHREMSDNDVSDCRQITSLNRWKFEISHPTPESKLISQPRYTEWLESFTERQTKILNMMNHKEIEQTN